MKITLNGKISPQAVDKMLTEQEEKKKKIIAFCKTNKIEDLQYKDSELEFEYHSNDRKTEKQFTTPKSKVETRGGAKDGKA